MARPGRRQEHAQARLHRESRGQTMPLARTCKLSWRVSSYPKMFFPPFAGCLQNPVWPFSNATFSKMPFLSLSAKYIVPFFAPKHSHHLCCLIYPFLPCVTDVFIDAVLLCMLHSCRGVSLCTFVFYTYINAQ